MELCKEDWFDYLQAIQFEDTFEDGYSRAIHDFIGLLIEQNVEGFSEEMHSNTEVETLLYKRWKENK